MLVEGYTSLNPEGRFSRGDDGVESHPHTLTIVQAQWLDRAVDSPFQTQTLCWFAFGLFSSTDNPTKWLSVEKEEPVRLLCIDANVNTQVALPCSDVAPS